MKAVLTLITALFAGSFSFAYQEGTYLCSSLDKPQYRAIFRITNVSLAAGVQAPFLDVTRYIPEDSQNPESKVNVYKFRGIATYFADDAGNETLMLGAVTLEFKNGKIVGNCKLGSN